MIIYFNKKTGKIYGAILGRVHNEFELRDNLIQPKNVDQKDVVRHIFDVAETIEVEKYLQGGQIKIIGCKVVFNNKDEIGIERLPKKDAEQSKVKYDPTVKTGVLDAKA